MLHMVMVFCVLFAEASLEDAVMSQPTEPLGKHGVAPNCNSEAFWDLLRSVECCLYVSRSGLTPAA